MKNLEEFNGVFFTEGTPEGVKEVISNNIRSSERFRIWYGKNGVSWNESNDITGYFRRTTGTKKISILVHSKRSTGGGAILTDCIVKIVRISDGRVMYQHPNFKQPYFEVTCGDIEEWPFNVLSDGDIYARCKSLNTAIRVMDFMNGKRHSK